MRTESIDQILAGVKLLLRGRKDVSLPEQGLDLLFDEGVVARCRECRLSWEVKRSQFKSPGWWSCPNGCRTRTPAAVEGANHSCSA